MDLNKIIAKAACDKLTAEECTQLAQLCQDEESARRELSMVKRRGKVSAIAAAHNFADVEYLDFLTAKSELSLEDDTSVTSFMNALADSAPKFFTVKLSSGAGGGNDNSLSRQIIGSDPAATAHSAAAAPSSVRDIAKLLEFAPEINS